MEVVPGRPDLNCRTMLDMIGEARRGGAHIIVFPEMSVPGYLLGNTWGQRAFLRDCEEYGRQVIKASSGICVLFGNVGVDWNRTTGGRVCKYNAVFVAQNGRLIKNKYYPYPFQIKEYATGCPDFDEARHFCSLSDLARDMGPKAGELKQPVRINIGGEPLLLACSFYNEGNGDERAAMSLKGAHLLINIAASPFAVGKNNLRKRFLSGLAAGAGAPLIFVNNVGIQNSGKTVYTYDGGSAIFDGFGEIIDCCAPFTPELKFVDLDFGCRGRNAIPIPVAQGSDIGSTYSALNYGIRKFLAMIGMKRVVIGVSGGIDSAVSAALYGTVLDPGDLLLVSMPSMYTSRTTRDLAGKLARNLGCLYSVMPIQDAVEFTVGQISKTPVINMKTGKRQQLAVAPFVAENIQARDRSARILAGVAAAFGGGFTCNSNKSEMTIGYATMCGDLAGFLAALADLWKYQVYGLAGYLNEHVYRREVIPRESIDIVPSAELSFEQAVDEGKGDPVIYPYHDYLFRAFMEREDRVAPEDILTWWVEGVLEERIGCRPGLVKRIFKDTGEFIFDLERWWTQYTGIGVAKRIQSPPVLAVSRRPYGFGQREAQNRVHFTASYLRLKKEALKHKTTEQ